MVSIDFSEVIFEQILEGNKMAIQADIRAILFQAEPDADAKALYQEWLDMFQEQQGGQSGSREVSKVEMGRGIRGNKEAES